MRVSLLLNYIKKDYPQEILHRTASRTARCPCLFGHVQCATREGLRVEYVVFNLQGLLTVVCLKVGDHEF
jgi:hypothetical protein